MEKNGQSMISGKYRKIDYINLHLNMNSESRIWEKAIAIFEDRFNERYFSAVRFLRQNPEEFGFAIMALDCLLIDTFCQFENGLEQNSNNKRNYTGFLMNNMSHLFQNRHVAESFYTNIRCGILHSAQTNNKSILSFAGTNAITVLNTNAQDPIIKVDVIQFSSALEQYFKNYIKRLRDGDQNTRINFIKKMDFLCAR